MIAWAPPRRIRARRRFDDMRMKCPHQADRNCLSGAFGRTVIEGEFLIGARNAGPTLDR